jgi:hypothetical protein
MKPSLIKPSRRVSATLGRDGERGAALAIAIIMLALMAVISATVLAIVTTESNVAGSDLQRARTFDAATASMEKMANEFSNLFQRSNNPTADQLSGIANNPPAELIAEGFTFDQTLTFDSVRMDQMRGTSTDFPSVTIPNGPYAGLYASVTPYKMTCKARQTGTGTEVSLEREINNYLIPLFQFGIFGDGDVELHPGPQFTFNGRVHANGNLYLNGNTKLLNKVTTANEIVTDVQRNGMSRVGNVRVQVGSIEVQMTKGSVNNGPNFPGTSPGQRGYHPGSPDGTANTSWDSTSVAAAVSGVPNQFGKQVLTRSTGASSLLLPLQLGSNSPRELIKRPVGDPAAEKARDQVLSESRYHNKAQIRIWLDSAAAGADASGIPAGQGVDLSTFNPIPLGGGNALRRVDDSGNYISAAWTQRNGGVPKTAETVRNIRNNYAVTGVPTSPNGAIIPPGSGLSGRILIQIVAPDGTVRDVTREILSMGVTVGEPNAIIHLQRPLWAAFVQGSRDRNGAGVDLVSLMNNATTRDWFVDGEIMNAQTVGATTTPVLPNLNATPGHGATNFNTANGYITAITDDPGGSVRNDNPTDNPEDPAYPNLWNQIVPISIYNVREGWNNGAPNNVNTTIYERGIMSVVEINMRNLARWVDGVYDNNLLSGTAAVSANIDGTNGYIVYVSDRRGDRIKSEYTGYDPITGMPLGLPINTTNGMVDNEDIYGPNGVLDPGEDVIDSGIDPATGQPKKGTLQKDTLELPDMGLTWTNPANNDLRLERAIQVLGGFARIGTTGTGQPIYSVPYNTPYFRRSVRLFNGENMVISGAAGKLSSTKGITISAENMIFIWGNYNTTGVSGQPTGGSTLNQGCGSQPCYQGNQIPASIVADAFSPLSKTWFDAYSAMYPQGNRTADANLPGITSTTSVRAGIIAGNNLGALAGTPDAGNGGSPNESRLNGGIHNFPRFLEYWSDRWNFVGSLIPLYHSTQALGPYNANSTIYNPPIRNWAFDDTFRDPNKLPPGTPSFQYLESTGFRERFR